MYIDAAYCYRQSSMFCLSVGWSVRLSIGHTSEPCKMAEPVQMPFGLRTHLGPGNHDTGTDHPWEEAIFEREGHPIVKYRDTLQLSLQKRLN